MKSEKYIYTTMKVIKIFCFYSFYLRYQVQENKALTLSVKKLFYSAETKILPKSKMKVSENAHIKNRKLMIEPATKMGDCSTTCQYETEEPKYIEIPTLISSEI